LLQGNGASILVQKLEVPASSADGQTADKVSEETNSDQTANLETSMVTNVCCAIANFATNGKNNKKNWLQMMLRRSITTCGFLTGESQQKLMTQPHLLQNLCATAALYSSNTEIHRHIARCFANFALYGK
jgi:hypothetical protein